MRHSATDDNKLARAVVTLAARFARTRASLASCALSRLRSETLKLTLAVSVVFTGFAELPSAAGCQKYGNEQENPRTEHVQHVIARV